MQLRALHPEEMCCWRFPWSNPRLKFKRLGRLWPIVLVLFGSSSVFAQDTVQVEVTLFGGLPLQNVVRSNICCGASFFVSQQVDATPYLAGGSVGVLLHDRIRLDFGAVYMPFSYTTTGTTCCPLTRPTTFSRGHVWELPILGAYRWKYGPLRPFAGGGFIAQNAITSVPDDDQYIGPVVRGGFDWEFNRFSIRPEFRYIHFPQVSTSTSQFIGRPSSQVEALVGLSFRLGIAR
jgi:hypothetical protein